MNWETDLFILKNMSTTKPNKSHEMKSQHLGFKLPQGVFFLLQLKKKKHCVVLAATVMSSWSREPPSHQQLWREMPPHPLPPASCRRRPPPPPPLHKGLPKEGRHLGSACALQPSSARLHTGGHSTDTGRWPHMGDRHRDRGIRCFGFYHASTLSVFFCLNACQADR